MLQSIVKQSESFSPNSKMVIFGGGFSGQHIGSVARLLGAKVLCSRRSINTAGADFVFNSVTNEIPSKDVLNDATHLLSCIPPGNNGKDPVIELLGESIKKIPWKWVGYLSTTGVYGDSKGKWVNESNPTDPKQPRSKRRLQCENEWRKSGLPIQILRLPGIYGPGRSALETVINRKCRLIYKPEQIFSRIHIDDIAGAIMHLISLSEKGTRPEIVNIADDLPSTNIEVLTYAGKLLKSSLPSIEPFEIASKTMSSMALSFWEENRRVSNKLLCEDLNYSLIHPNFKSGLEECCLILKNKA